MSYRKVLITQFGDPDVLELVTESTLPEPERDEVRVRILATSAAFTDTLIRKGIYPGVRKKPPFSPGYDLVGKVDKTGSKVKDLETGQLVAAMPVIGAYSEYLCVPAKKLVPVPADTDPVTAVSMVLSYLTAYQMLHHKAKIKEGQTILVHGAGGAVGSAVLQLGKLMGLTMFGTASKSKHELLRKEGALPIDYRSEDFVKRILEETENGVDAVFDAIGGDHFNRSFTCLKRGGILVAYGFYNAGVGKGGSFFKDLINIFLKGILPNGRKATFYGISYNKWFSGDLRDLFNLLSEGKIAPVIEKTLPLEQAAEAHRLIEKAKVKGKIVLVT